MTQVKPGPLVNDYPYRHGNPQHADKWGFYQRECTSFAAWRIRGRLGIAFTNHWRGVHWGNAKNWSNAARHAGLRVDRHPAVGAIAQWTTGKYGHVAYVARVNGNMVTLEEFNKGGTHRYHYPQRTINASRVDNFIHFKN